MDVEEEPSIAYINLIPGDLFADLRQANDRFHVRSLDMLNSHQTSVRNLTRRLSEQPTGAHAFLDFETVEIDEDKKYYNTFARFLSKDPVLVDQIRLKKVQMPVKIPLEIASTQTKSKPSSSPRELSSLPAKAPPTVEAQNVEPPTAQALTVEPPAVDQVS